MSARAASKYEGETVSVKKFLKCFDETRTFICLTDKESEDDEDYVTGLNKGVIITAPEFILLAINHLDTPNTTYREVKGFPPSAEIFVGNYFFRASQVHLTPPKPIGEAPFLSKLTFFKYISYNYKGAAYIIKNQIPIPDPFTSHLLKKDPNLIPLIPDLTPDQIKALLLEDPYRIRFFPTRTEFYDQVITQQPYTLQYLAKPSEELIMKALSLNGTAIQFVPSPTPKYCEAAVKQNYMTITTIPRALRTKELIELTKQKIAADKSTNLTFESLSLSISK